MTASDTAPSLLPTPGKFGYRPGLDGVRAVAVVAVVLYHADVTWMPGGFLGVEVFFVLSGYLITSLLVTEFSGSRTLDVKGFWVRRGRRLLPAVWALLAGVFLLVLFHPGEVARFFRELPSALAYVYNWFQVRSNESYFAAMGRPSPLRHLWSLAVEEQFYLVWPIIAIVALRKGGRRWLLRVTLALMAISIILTLVLFEPGADPSRIYYGTDTRAAGLLLGAAGAVLWHPARRVSPLHRTAMVRAGTVALVLLGIGFWRIDEYGSFLYRGGLFGISVLTLVVVVAATDSQNPVARALSIPPMRWLGTRSYAIYLWHWPVMVFTRPMVDIAIAGAAAFSLRLALTAVLAEASYRLVETRFRHWTPTPRSDDAPARSWLPVTSSPLLVGGVATVLLAVVGLTVMPAWQGAGSQTSAYALASAAGSTLPSPLQPGAGATTPSAAPDDASSDPQEDPTATATPRAANPPPTAASTRSPTPTPAPTPAATPAPAASTPPPAPDVPGDQPLATTIGDSIMAGAIPELDAAFGGRVIVDAQVARASSTMISTMRWHADNGTLAPTVVIHAGSNGPLDKGFVDAVMDVAGPDREVIFLTVRLPRRWEDSVNDDLRADVPAHDNARLLDWHGASDSNPGWFNSDGMHIINMPGADQYAALIHQAVTG